MVVENKDEGPKHYAVRQRNGSVYIPGKNPQPVNGKVIGHIYEGKFIPIEETPAANGPTAVSYGSSHVGQFDFQERIWSTFLTEKQDY